MSSEMPKCKITVLKRTINQDLIDEYLDDSYKDNKDKRTMASASVLKKERNLL